MKFSDCLSAMVEGKVAVKDGVERALLTGETMNVIEETHWDEDCTKLKTFKTIDFDEEGWEIKEEPREVCGIKFTRTTDDAGIEVWVSDERGLSLTRRTREVWLCKTCGDDPKLVSFGKTAEESVRRVLQEAEEVARMVARVLGTAEASK